MKLGKRLPRNLERRWTAIGSMIPNSVGGDSKLAMLVVETRRVPLVAVVAEEIPCPTLVGSAPVNGSGSTCFSRAITVDHSELLATHTGATSGVYRFTWPALTFIGNLYTFGSVTGIDVAVSPSGDVFVVTISGTTITLLKNGASLTSWTRTGAGGGGVCFADGYVWVVVNGSGGDIYRVDPSTGANTSIATSGSTYGAVPTPASDGAVWFAEGSTLYRHKSGITTSATAGAHGTYRVPRYDGEIKIHDSGTGNWEQWAPGPTSVPLDCDPEAEGFFDAPRSSFYDPALEVVGMQDIFDQVFAYV